ncbi:MAG TPA: hypothetical protein VF432_08105 [Thermoanaerobaculia bacterium]
MAAGTSASASRSADCGTFDFLGRHTHYDMWTVPGASGSTNLSADGGHRQRVVGVTAQVGHDPMIRLVPDAAQFVSQYDADGNGVPDAVDL